MAGASKRRSRLGAPSRSQSSDVRVVSVLGEKLWAAVSSGLVEHGVGPKMLHAYVTALHKAIGASPRHTWVEGSVGGGRDVLD